MLGRANPLTISALAVAGPDPKQLEKQISELIATIRGVDQEQLGWLRKQAELVELRLGVRRKKSVPWQGASNISIPLTDGIIRRWRPGVVSLVIDADPVAFFSAQSPEDVAPSRVAEQFFTFLFRDTMETTEQVIQLVDTIAWRGHAYTRQGWDYQTAREARIVEAAKLFPPNIGEFVQAAMQEAQAAGQETSPEDIVVRVLEDEYGMDRQDPNEGPALLATAQQLLQGAPFVKIVYRRVRTDRPCWQVIDPINTIVPQNQKPGDSEFFVIIHTMNQDEMRALAVDGHLDEGRVNALLEQVGKSARGAHGDSPSMNMREHILDLKNIKAGLQKDTVVKSVPRIVVWEIYAKLDLNGDGERERCVLWYAPDSGTTLGLLDFVFPFDKWPITYYPFEACARPHDNRGLAEMLMPFQRIASALRNAMIDAAQILLAPVLQIRQASGNYRKNVKWRPGSLIPVTNMGDLQPVPMNFQILEGLLAQEQINQRTAETYVGVFDATINSLQQTKERRTAAEINAITSVSSNIFGLDAKTFTTALGRSFTQVWQLWEEFGQEEVFFRVQGEQQPRLSKKSEICRSYDIRASGTPASTNRAFQMATMERAMQLILSNPLILQSGRVDWATMFEQWMELNDHKLARSIILPPEQATAVQQILQAAQLATGVEPPPL